VERSIPNLCDGLKVSQRKILYACFKKNLFNKEIKVAQLSGYVSENASYHHGEASLQGAIINMAQDFVGSNNINLLLPKGQFGTRRTGKDSASPRYIYTCMNPIVSKLYHKEDLDVLTYLQDDGMTVEPEYYIPIIPMILVNGAIGIGTGFSTNVPCYNPRDIIKVLKSLLTEDNTIQREELVPWYKGFTGVIQKRDDKFISRGTFQKTGSTTVEVTELPIGTWTLDFKEFLEKYIEGNTVLKSYESHSTDVKVRFILNFSSAETLDDYITLDGEGFCKLEKEFNLVSTKFLNTNNMYLFNSKCQIQKYGSPEDIIADFFNVRLDFYKKRKDNVLSKFQTELDVLNNKVRFIQSVVDESICIQKMTKVDIEELLTRYGYLKVEDTYAYLLKIPLYKLTVDEVESLSTELKKKKEEFHRVQQLDIKEWWLQELIDLENVL
jgi:DNA topoisomerase-2